MRERYVCVRTTFFKSPVFRSNEFTFLTSIFLEYSTLGFYLDHFINFYEFIINKIVTITIVNCNCINKTQLNFWSMKILNRKKERKQKESALNEKSKL